MYRNASIVFIRWRSDAPDFRKMFDQRWQIRITRRRLARVRLIQHKAYRWGLHCTGSLAAGIHGSSPLHCTYTTGLKNESDFATVRSHGRRPAPRSLHRLHINTQLISLGDSTCTRDIPIFPQSLLSTSSRKLFSQIQQCTVPSCADGDTVHGHCLPWARRTQSRSLTLGILTSCKVLGYQLAQLRFENQKSS